MAKHGRPFNPDDLPTAFDDGGRPVPFRTVGNDERRAARAQPRDYPPPRQTAQPPSKWNGAGVIAFALGCVLSAFALVVLVGVLAARW